MSARLATRPDPRELRGVGVELWWIPLGAGGWFVAFNGRAYERWRAWRERRPRLALYHTALVVRAPEGRFVIENAWPIPDEAGESRGVVVEGPVFGRAFGRLRTLRYEVRRWRDGVIGDAPWADAPHVVATGSEVARRVLALVPLVPARVWGRDEARAGEMWNSASSPRATFVGPSSDHS